MDSDTRQMSEAITKMVPVIITGIGIAALIAMSILWGLGVALSKGQGPSLNGAIKKAIERFTATVSKYPMAFAAAIVFLIGNQMFMNLSGMNTPAAAQDMQAAISKMMLSLVSLGLTIASTTSMAICQFLTFKNNRDIDQPGTTFGSKGDVAVFFFLAAAQVISAMMTMIATIFFFVPGLIVQILYYVTGPASVVEVKAAGAIGRSFELCTSKFWSVAKIAMPVTIITTMPAVIYGALGHGAGNPVMGSLIGASVSAIGLVLSAIAWNTQSELYAFLTDGKVES